MTKHLALTRDSISPSSGSSMLHALVWEALTNPEHLKQWYMQALGARVAG